MSEYQYYEFQTAERRLSEKERQELRSYSTRAQITPTCFSNEYSFGDFKGNPDAWMEKYFDGYLYLANWGTHEFQLALPACLLSAETVGRYLESSSFREKSGRMILTFRSEEECGDGWVRGEGILSSLLPLRTDLGQGDLRILYIGWLLNVQNGEFEEESIEPPVPPNLGDLSGPLSDLVEFLRLDPDLLATAAESSLRQETPPASREDLAAWIAQLPASDKDEILIRLLSGEEAVLGVKLRFNRSRAATTKLPEPPARSAGKLLADARTLYDKRQRAQAEKAAREKARQQQEAAIARQKHLAALAGQESQLWTKIEALVATKLPKHYDLALQHLIDLRDLASGKGAEFSQRLARLRESHARKPSWIARLQANGL